MKFGITGNIHNDRTRETVAGVLRSLDIRKVDYILGKKFAKDLCLKEKGTEDDVLAKSVDMIFAFGGDGTLLDIAKRFCLSGIPILGVNTGHLGFLTEIPPEKLPQRIDDLLKGKYVIEKRIVIEAVVPENSGKSYLAVNDIVFDKGGYPRSMKSSLSVEKEFCHTYTSDGIIISTATGSTAYSLSAGGPIIYPSIDNILITPICPHMLSARPMIVPGSFSIEIEIVFGPESVSMHADGRPATNLHISDKIIIRKSEHSLNLVHFPDHNFFRVLRTKMDW